MPSDTRTACRVPPERLRWSCAPEAFAFRTTDEIPPSESIIGQARAVRALDFGLSIKQPGYNIFIAGPAGTGRTTYTRARVSKVAAEDSRPSDWCYVFNFQDPDQPTALALSAGRGAAFRQDMAELIDDLKSNLHKVFAGEEYERRRQEIIDRHNRQTEALWQEADAKAHAVNFHLQRSSSGIMALPLGPDGRPIPPEQLELLPPEVRAKVDEITRGLQDEVADFLRKVQQMERAAREHLRQVDEETGRFVVGPLIRRLKEACADLSRVLAYLEAVEADVVQNLHLFRAEGSEAAAAEIALARYKVNLLVDHSQTSGAPVVIEPNPTYYNLFGKVEYRPAIGAMTTDFTMIKGGALHRANGGYLILQAADLLSNPAAYPALKRGLESREIRTENLSEQVVLLPTVTLRPEPIPLDVKVLLIGNPYVYVMLYHLDEDFRRLFKIKADFDIDMPRTPETLHQYAAAIGTIIQRCQLLPFDRAALARVVEHSARLAEHQEKLSTRFSEVVEVLQEASAWAAADGKKAVGAAHVQQALDEKIYRNNRIEERIREMIAKGQILVDVEGAKVGQVNGLSVLGVGDYSFGRPSRITARTYVGGRGVI
ncbi:MAG: AAA family ATPase, partial [Armatimonadetes bacterium]|nr:AAA family ATPase [Armatimonadota bacterium]